MKIVRVAVFAVICLTSCKLGVAQFHSMDPHADVRADVRAGIHSGSWTLERAQRLEAESQDPTRSCPDPYCARCAKHLANYGHEFQFLGGPSQHQRWYRGTAGNIAVVTQRGFDQHSRPYLQRGRPAAVISWEYVRALNRAIEEQVNARNAVAIEEAAHDRVVLLTALLETANEQLRLTREAWEQIAPLEHPCNRMISGRVVGSLCTKTFKQFRAEMRAGRFDVARTGFCAYCLAHARYQFDLDYVADVERELALAYRHWKQRSAVATEAVRIALLSRSDAEKATRFMRIQFKQPRRQEVFAAMGIADPLFAGPPSTDPLFADPLFTDPLFKEGEEMEMEMGMEEEEEPHSVEE